ncbi:MAG: hypothetical protein IT337_05435 [Thermomicrobiales bacterium]|nr:hypothetical protein [Thermomicrobiales bacterium]
MLNPGASFVGDGEVQILPVTFMAMDPFWRTRDETSSTVTMTQSSAVALINDGKAKAYPTFEITPITQRASETAAVGWKWRRQVTIGNASTEDWHDHPVCIDLGDTAAWVTASDALSSGNDVRIRYQGEEFNRTLVNFNTKRTLCWFTCAIKAGGTITVDVIYGNPSANAPGTMSLRTGTRDTYIAFDLEGASGTATAGGAATLTMSGAGWEINRWRNGYIQITDGTGAGQRRRIASNTGTVITVARNWSTQPDTDSTFVIWMSGIFADGGRVTTTGASSIVDNAHATGWGVNQLEGATVVFFGGGTANPTTMTVQSNTADTITFTSSFAANPTVGDSYRIERYGVRNYVVDTALTETIHRGVYRQNRYYEPSDNVWPGQLTPGGWGPDTYLDNNDRFSQLGPWNSGSGGGHTANYWPLPRARRKKRQAKGYKDDRSGDGMSTYIPSRLQGAYIDYRFKNKNGIGKAVFAWKGSGGEQWSDIATNQDTYASLTDIAAQYIDLNAVNNPTRFGMFALPYDGVSIEQTIEDEGSVTARTSTTVTDSAETWVTNQWAGGQIKFDNTSTAVPKTMTIASNTGTVATLTSSFETLPTVADAYTISRDVLNSDEVEVRTNDVLILYEDLEAYSNTSSSIFAVGSAHEIYDANMILRLGGGAEADKTPPYDLVRVGGDGHSLHLKLTEKLVIRTDPATNEPFAAVYDFSDNLIYRAGWAVRIYRYELDVDGNAVALISREFMPLQPATQLITNYSFDGNITGWSTGLPTTTVGVDVDWAYDGAVSKDGIGGSLRATINSAPVGDWATSYQSATFDLVGGAFYDVGVWARTDDVALDVEMEFDISESPLLAGKIDLQTLAAVDTWYPLGVGLTALEGTPTGQVTLRVRGNGNTPGVVHFDLVTTRTPNLYVSETAMGEIRVLTRYVEGYSG